MFFPLFCSHYLSDTETHACFRFLIPTLNAFSYNDGWVKSLYVTPFFLPLIISSIEIHLYIIAVLQAFILYTGDFSLHLSFQTHYTAFYFCAVKVAKVKIDMMFKTGFKYFIFAWRDLPWFHHLLFKILKKLFPLAQKEDNSKMVIRLGMIMRDDNFLHILDLHDGLNN